MKPHASHAALAITRSVRDLLAQLVRQDTSLHQQERLLATRAWLEGRQLLDSLHVQYASLAIIQRQEQLLAQHAPGTISRPQQEQLLAAHARLEHNHLGVRGFGVKLVARNALQARTPRVLNIVNLAIHTMNNSLNSFTLTLQELPRVKNARQVTKGLGMKVVNHLHADRAQLVNILE